MFIIKKFINILKTLGATIVIGGIFAIICLPIINYSIEHDKDDLNGNRCENWNKQLFDNAISELFPNYVSYINCNTYYLELENVEVSELYQIPNKFNFTIDIQIIVNNSDSIIIATINEENKIVLNQSTK